MFDQKYQFNFPTIIRFGKDVILELGPHLKEQGLKKPLIVTDPNLVKLPVFSTVVNVLEDAGIHHGVFFDIAKNPVFKNVEDGAAQYHAEQCDSIIGLGGGASMDVARTIAMRVNHPGNLEDYIEENGGDQKITNPIPYFVTIPTTSGTGSEVGRSSVISHDTTHEKKIFFHPNLLAPIVFADPGLTMELPASVTAATGMDALTHNIEALLARGFHPMADGIALEGIRLAGEALVSATNNPSYESRAKMMASSTMGAVAFQKGLGVIHSCAHSLSTHFDLHHGLANAIMLPHGLRFNQSACEDQFKRMAQVLGTQDVVQFCHELASELGIKMKLSDYGITIDDIDKLSAAAIKDVCHPCNPVTVTQDDFKNIFQAAL